MFEKIKSLFESSEMESLMDELAQEDDGELIEDTAIILTDENGEEVRFEFLDYIEYENMGFVVLLPEDESEGEVVILQVVTDPQTGEDSYESIDDDEVLNAVFMIFKEKFKDEFNFED